MPIEQTPIHISETVAAAAAAAAAAGKRTRVAACMVNKSLIHESGKQIF
jgi:hypothetical protein